ERQKRNFLATLFLSQGVPMLVSGDELSRTQGGNNNAYCQDNEISWLDWTMTDEKTALLGFVRRMIDLRRSHPTFRRRDFFAGRALHGGDLKDLRWLKADGHEMSDEEWEHEHARCLGMYLSGSAISDLGRHGRPIVDDDFLIVFNAGHEDVVFHMPSIGGEPWRALIDTREATGVAAERRLAGDDGYPLIGRSLVVLTRAAAGT
ncbi:MAG: glycogen debranching enzyme GlgX, partial [Caldimonas sp.]